MIEEFSVQVPAPAGEEARTVSVYLPKAHTPCAVLYAFDGQTAFSDERAPFGSSLRLGELLDAHAVPLIVVGVDCDKANRLTEYSPFPFRFEGKGASEGKGKIYMDWLTGVLKPLIDGRYPTLRDRAHTFVMGSSMGGLMTIYALSEHADFFSGGIAMSPSVWADAEKCAALAARIPADARLYLDYGTAELNAAFPAQRAALDAVLAALKERGGAYRFDFVKGAKHNEAAWRKRLPAALAFLGFGIGGQT